MKRLYIAAITLFLVPIFAMGFISLVDQDATVSATENRNLKEKPSLTFQTLFDGSFAKDFEEYYSDTFPFRDAFMNVNQGVRSLFTWKGEDDVTIVDPGQIDHIGAGEHLQDGDLPDSSSSESSSSSPSSSSAPSSSANASSESASSQEEASSPVEVPDDTEVDNHGGVIIVKDRAMELFSLNEKKLTSYTDTLNKMKTQLPSSTRVFNLLAPTSVEFYSPSKYHSLTQSQKGAFDLAYSQLQDVIPVDAYSAIAPHTDEYLYFRTDHHWTARGAYYAYTAFAKQAGFTPVDINDFETGQIDDFVGSLYRATQAQVLKDNPDYVEYFLPNVENEGKYFKSQDMTDGITIHAVATKVNSSNKYLCFISGDTLLSRFTTGVKNGKSILVIKESYGNAFVPWLLNHYENVYVCDPRQGTINIPSFVRDNNVDDVLAINYAFSACSGFNKYIDKCLD
ncbi:DHHW family protein [Solibaculum mannosilyticum]|uniref:AlgX/AlgJ SGNH hydrolase-like domain-containing protein n=1 Tax=Solibaculum mannosilyticum TaxID=2780922 RepID=A0A7I8D5F3_9FIRM|nr:DHHW family protein [Solibaculum mannosilyticum]BCI60679.1 hypothetical protein C12CBH8_13180 [Solibaculum mannosilyticum]